MPASEPSAQATQDGKGRVTVTLDRDVISGVEGVAKAQRDSFSGMVNRMLATVLGLIPRERDMPTWTE